MYLQRRATPEELGALAERGRMAQAGHSNNYEAGSG